LYFMRKHRSIVLYAICLLLAAGFFAVPIHTAHAVSVDVTCAGTDTITYQPGLLLTPQTVGVATTKILAPCTSSDPTITAGTMQSAFTATLSCSTLFAGRSGTEILSWSNRRSSTFTFNRAVNDVGGQTTVTQTGSITSGEFAGATAVEQIVYVTPSTLQCLAPPGLTTLGPGSVVLTISTP